MNLRTLREHPRNSAVIPTPHTRAFASTLIRVYLRFRIHHMKPCIFLLALCLSCAAAEYAAFEKSPHDYWTRPLTDRFTRIKADLESGRLALDTTSERACLLSLLKALDVPASSQMLVFSTTSLQLRFITPQNPRALFFSEDLYIGYIPGARIEIVSLDPALGGIYYIFDLPLAGQPVRVERSDRCMNCHAKEDTGDVPGLVVKSVLPSPAGGSVTAYRIGKSGHSIPFADRFGGWYLTGKHNIAQHWGNAIGRYNSGVLQKIPIEPGKHFDFARYPAATSDILPQLLHEHQVGFVNRVVEATYLTRTHLAASGGNLTPQQSTELDEKARAITRYILFADEVPLPAGGIEGDATFRADFARNRRPAKDGTSLKDLDLHTRLLRHRCSYMIYSAVFTGLPPEMKQRIHRHLATALSETKPAPEYAYLPAPEKRAIRTILQATLPDFP